MSTSLLHNQIMLYLFMLLSSYFHFKPLGQVVTAEFGMKYDPERPPVIPDLQIILHTNTARITNTALMGSADICIEIVSPGNPDNDYITKFEIYQQAGVKEYWLLDPRSFEHRFFRLNERGIYISQVLDANANYSTPLLSGLQLHVPILWKQPLPDPIAIVQSIQVMLNE
jgi:Uma2 family endonuclease